MTTTLFAGGGLILGLIVGFMLARIGKGQSGEARAEKELEEYREQVAQHFAATAKLVNRMTDSYREVFDELQSGAQSLIGEERLKELLADESGHTVTIKRIGYQKVPPDAVDKPESAPAESSEPADSTKKSSGAKAGSPEPADESGPEKSAAPDDAGDGGEDGSDDGSPAKPSEADTGRKGARKGKDDPDTVRIPAVDPSKADGGEAADPESKEADGSDAAKSEKATDPGKATGGGPDDARAEDDAAKAGERPDPELTAFRPGAHGGNGAAAPNGKSPTP